MGAFRRSLASNLSPLVLRVALGVTFLWAGYPKIWVKEAYPPEAAAVLANLGVEAAQDAAIGAAAPLSTPEGERPAGALPDPSSDAGAARVVLAQAASAARIYTPEDFTGPVSLARLYGVALALEASSTSPAPLWPPALAGRPWSVRWAHAVAWTEFLGGAFVLIGLFTPLSGFALACVMGVAMWLTQIGPATLGGGADFLGVLPPMDYGANPMGWQSFVFQLTLFAVALSLLFTGGGAVSVDRFIFGRSGGDGSSRGGRASYNSDDEDGEDEDDE